MCIALGYPHPDYLLAYLDSRQLQEWICYYTERPFGHEVETIQSAQIAAMIAASSGQRVTVDQFLPWSHEEEEAKPETTLAAMPGGAAAIQELLNKAATDGANSKPQHRAGGEYAEGGEIT